MYPIFVVFLWALPSHSRNMVFEKWSLLFVFVLVSYFISCSVYLILSPHVECTIDCQSMLLNARLIRFENQNRLLRTQTKTNILVNYFHFSNKKKQHVVSIHWFWQNPSFRSHKNNGKRNRIFLADVMCFLYFWKFVSSSLRYIRSNYAIWRKKIDLFIATWWECTSNHKTWKLMFDQISWVSVPDK